MARQYNTGRALSREAELVWRAALEPHVRDADRILDVGSGTGRFSVLLARWFGATVIGVEPAGGMRRIAMRDGQHPTVRYVGGRAEQLPLRDDAVSVALLSNVYHHVRGRADCARELRRVVRSSGGVLVGGAFAGRLGEITLFAYFPEAKVVCEQFPTLEDTVATFNAAGFTVETVTRVQQQTCASLKEFAALTRTRADTTLALLSDEVFARRQRALEEAASDEVTSTPVLDTLDLLVVRNAGKGART